ncbi:hypothetical protein, partial [Pseudomonas aeruginosa]|uniref:hypothetical protein n=1 Tax=Pseudomonas aeruginosa TaxID=287 RepID=UPI0031B6E968
LQLQAHVLGIEFGQGLVLDQLARRGAFVCRYNEINQKIRRGRSLVQQPDQKPLTQQGLTV